MSRPNSLLLIAALWLALACGATRAATIAVPPGVTSVTEVEGISEYRLKNGLQVLLVPDASKPTTTVNVTYHVGSRHESYGETGMAHLLEHLMFKGTPRHRTLWEELTKRGMPAKYCCTRVRVAASSNLPAISSTALSGW